MRYLLNSQQMKNCDNYTIEAIGLPSMVLMERAALAVYEELLGGSYDLRRVLVVCGCGNNGGDGMAVARLLKEHGVCVELALAGDEAKCSEQAACQLKICRAIGLEPVSKPESSEYTMVIDAIFGIGLTRDVEGIFLDWIHKINQMDASVLSVDIPSGINADNGRVMGSAVHADVTVTFAFGKIGLYLYPGADYAGRVLVRDIGITAQGFSDHPPKVFACGPEDLAELPPRFAYSNKGSFGKVLLAAGSRNMAGAAYLAGKAAYRAGAGLVRIFTPEGNRAILQSLLPEAILTTYEESVENAQDFEALLEAIQWADVIGVGPGLGKSFASLKILETILTQSGKPLVIDADGLNLLASHLDWLENHSQPIILTPHLGEMSRLSGIEIPKLQENLAAEAAAFAENYHVICVLKDARTVTALPDKTIYINTSGNHGMATGGSGDVLTGILTGLIAQGGKLELTTPLGVYLHGMAGDRAAQATGRRAMMADDLIDNIQTVLKETEP